MISGSTLTFGAATTTKALLAQTRHKVPLDNSSNDFSHWSEVHVPGPQQLGTLANGRRLQVWTSEPCPQCKLH